MHKLSCKLTGGHKYEDKNQRYTYDVTTNSYIFYNYCVKCGERIEYSESAQTFLSDFDKALRELFQK